MIPPIDQFISGDTVPPICLPAAAQVVRLVPGSSVPKSDNSIRKDESEDDDPRYVRPQSPLGYLEVADVGRRYVLYLIFYLSIFAVVTMLTFLFQTSNLK